MVEGKLLCKKTRTTICKNIAEFIKNKDKIYFISDVTNINEDKSEKTS